jgi:hypothetical protein
MKKRPESLPHPLFHSLVIMGGGAAVACGGMASNDGGSGLGEPSTGGSGTGGFPGTGGSPGTGGIIEMGGSAATGGTSGVVILPCPPAQWVCDQNTADNLACGPRAQILLGCSCDPKRPLTADQCGPSELFVCRFTERYDDAGAVHVTNPFECGCRPVTPDSQGCKAVFAGQNAVDGYDYMTVGPDGGATALFCGCAWTYLI